MGRVLCVDYGRRRVGLAVSDPLRRTAQPLEVIDRQKGRSLVEAVLEVVRRMEVEEIVVGLPLRLDGSAGIAAEATEQFARSLEERTEVPVVRWDERLSSKEAVRSMRSAGVRAREQRGVVDKLAAAVVLRSYLEAQNHDPAPFDEAALPEAVPPPIPEPPQERPEGGRAAAKRRSAEKRQTRRLARRRWRGDIEDGT